MVLWNLVGIKYLWPTRVLGFSARSIQDGAKKVIEGAILQGQIYSKDLKVWGFQFYVWFQSKVKLLSIITDRNNTSSSRSKVET